MDKLRYAGIGSRETPKHILELMAHIAYVMEKNGVILPRRSLMTTNKPEVVAWRWRKPVVNDQGETVGATAWELGEAPEFLPWWTSEPLIRLTDYETLQAECENWRHDSEDLEALHHNLDDVGVPRCDSAGTEYSAWGRVIQYAKAAAKAEARNE